MANLKKFAVEQTGILHLRDGNEELMYDDGEGGKPDKSKPCEIEVYSPGSKIYAAANAAQNNRLIDKMKSKGKSNQSAEDQAEEKAGFLADVTKSMRNVEYDAPGGKALEGKALFKAIYADREIGFIADQVQAFLGDWANFTKALPTS